MRLTIAAAAVFTACAVQAPAPTLNLDTARQDAASARPARTVDATELRREFEANTVAAADLARGQVYAVRGTVEGVGDERLDDVYGYRVAPGARVYAVRLAAGFVCVMDQAAEGAWVRRVRVGDPVLVQGVVSARGDLISHCHGLAP
jgi:uncharacterized lipoprotein YmbA